LTGDGKLFRSFGAAAWNAQEAVAVLTLGEGGCAVSSFALDERKVLIGA